MGIILDITIKKRKWLTESETVSILLEDSYASLSYESGGTNNVGLGTCKSFDKKISLEEYNKICDSLLSLNYGKILKENEERLIIHPYEINVELSTSSAKVIFEVKQQSKDDSNPETKRFLELYEFIMGLIKNDPIFLIENHIKDEVIGKPITKPARGKRILEQVKKLSLLERIKYEINCEKYYKEFLKHKDD